MSKQINFFLLLAVMTVFAACNNANKPTETVNEQDAPAMSAKEIAMSDIQKQKDKSGTLGEKATLATKKTAENTSNSSGLKDFSSATVGNKTNTGNTPMTDADRLRQRAAAQSANRNLIDAEPAPGKVEKEKAKATVKNTKISTPTVNTPTIESPSKMGTAPMHNDWNALLTQNVSSTGKVNYKGFKGAQSKLNTYLDKLKNNPPAAGWSRNEKMAYWINAYNAFTVKKIVDNYPLSSIQELSGGKVWDDKWINIGTKTYSLNEIENGILRPTYKDARIHFAVNCAAKSCPSLHNRAFTASNLESTLAKQTKKFVNNADFNTITAGKVTISKIFDWYGADFGDLNDFLNKYSNTAINADAAIDYTEYNWSLNE
ncbi:MAG: hypothetical protein ACI85O_001571 [Saprospiraceae bacterium]|jgi:hypothetical protein